MHGQLQLETHGLQIIHMRIHHNFQSLQLVVHYVSERYEITAVIEVRQFSSVYAVSVNCFADGHVHPWRRQVEFSVGKVNNSRMKLATLSVTATTASGRYLNR